MQNTLQALPNYTLHRIETGAPVAADSSDLSALHTAKQRSALNCRGFQRIRCFVKLTGGTTPTVDVEPLERVQYTATDVARTATDEFKPMRAPIAGLGDGDTFEVDVGGALAFLRISGVNGAPTQIEIFAGGTLEQNLKNK